MFLHYLKEFSINSAKFPLKWYGCYTVSWVSKNQKHWIGWLHLLKDSSNLPVLKDVSAVLLKGKQCYFGIDDIASTNCGDLQWKGGLLFLALVLEVKNLVGCEHSSLRQLVVSGQPKFRKNKGPILFALCWHGKCSDNLSPSKEHSCVSHRSVWRMRRLMIYSQLVTEIRCVGQRELLRSKKDISSF